MDVRKAIAGWAACLVGVAAIGFAFGYVSEAGSRLAPSRLRLAETMDRSSRSTDRLIGTLDDLINMHCTWSDAKQRKEAE